MRLAVVCPLLFTAGTLLAAPPEAGAEGGEGVPSQPAPEGVKGAPAKDPDRVRNLPRLLLTDAKQVVSAPFRCERPEWVTAGTAVAAVVGTGLLLDKAGDRFFLRNATPSWDRAAKEVQNLGGTPSLVIAGGTYLAGVVFKEPEVRATGVDALVTMGLAQLLLTLPLKVAVGRSRPSRNQGTQDFHPFQGGESFPSGHTTQAFALASVIAEHADRPWVSAVSYSLAGLVGLARMEQRQHFLSDVVAGGLIGTFVGKAVVATNQGLRARARATVSLSFAPTLQPGGYGFSLAMRF